MSIKIINVNSKKISCIGDHIFSLGHPIVFLIINPISKKAVCPYCSITYAYNENE